MTNYFLIDRIRGIEIIDSRGNPTLRVFVRTKGGIESFGDAPAGASKGTKEAIEIRDPATLSVKKAVEIVNYVVDPSLHSFDVRDQTKVDNTLIQMDSTENKSKIGGNSMIATSIAVLKTAAKALQLETFQYISGPKYSRIPIPLLNIINGGVHAGNKLKIQEFIIIPANFKTFKEALMASLEIYRSLKNLIAERYGKIFTAVGDEGGFSPPLENTRDALDLLVASIKNLGYEKQVFLGMDAASSEFFNEKKNTYTLDDKEFSPDKLEEYYLQLASEYPIIYLEDPFEENSFEKFSELQSKLKNTIVTGDDIYATNIKYLKTGIDKKSTRGVIVKPNQVGTLTETFKFIDLARSNSIKTIISHRSGETEDNFIADLAVGVSSDFIKTGAPARGERISKYNRLLEIENKYEIEYNGKYFWL
ncbi:phosphopyruvate hydratase [Sulfolobus sp. A20]|uniref:phosphopyruvate hydratase n=1 Tax=Sulfolobaceae TaxID=118883 RepID=UPI000845FBF6|nr:MULTISPECIES: phosphopyruvate hydratase [unclassified Sulfolobus]TRM78268.1 phosphopyruvate hydratase [Sulfolobus sp. A20-N-F8]TRM78338.1 phosphopyruvate hydratase [Sulfolobus sp. B5]TRM88488.1 phosphopyruvate hydratase [Sulfolobus sp. C3]TRM94447.1 phosphopyruvate hydratase [Sulfolobus sp. A20-N-G8]TRM99279.1 phosphopyruvate hydratase [Sulfolobus sp. E1]TRM99929.1 phosphopyruvate hydratase [Sulfolobus sp. F1]